MAQLNDFYRIIHSSFSLNSFWNVPNYKWRISKFERNVSKPNSVPIPEYGIKNMLEDIFNTKLDKVTPVTREKAIDETHSQLEVYRQDKVINSKNLDLDVIELTLKWISERLNISSNDVVVYSPEQAIDLLPSNSSSCAPLSLKKGNKKAIITALTDVLQYLKQPKYYDKQKIIYKYCCYIYNRFIPKIKSGKMTTKVRPVWGAPFHFIILEVMHLKWYVDIFKSRFSDFYTVDLTKVQVSDKIQKLRELAKSSDRIVFCGDVQGVDRSYSTNLYALQYYLLCHLVKDERFKMNLSLIWKFYTYTPYIDTDSRVRVTSGGNTSGVYLTNLINTFALILILGYLYYKIYNRFPNSGEFLVQGDDFIILLPKDCNLKFVKKIFNNFNFRLKIMSSPISKPNEDIEYLGYYWDRYGNPNQTDEWLLSKIYLPERYVELSGPDRVIIRYLSIIFNLKRANSLFKLFYNKDPILRQKIRLNKNPFLYIVDNVGKLHINQYPLQLFLTKGWKLL